MKSDAAAGRVAGEEILLTFENNQFSLT